MRTSKPLRRFLATLGLCLWTLMPHDASAQGAGQNEALQFIVGQLGLPADWKPVAGSSPPTWNVGRELFGLPGVRLESITAAGAAADGKPTGALTANLTLAGQKMSGTLGAKAGAGGPEEVWIQLTGADTLKVGQLLAGWTSKPRRVDTLDKLEFGSPRVGFRPAASLAYLSGTLAAGGKGSWKGNAAVTWAGARASLFVRAAEVDLQDLFQPAAPARLPKLPESVLLFNSGTGQAPALASLPLPVQAMFNEVTGGLRLPDAFPMGEGFGVWSRVTPQQLGIPEVSPLKLPAMLLGGEVNPGQSMALAAAIGARDLRLLNWTFTSPSFYLAHKQGEGPKLGVSAVVDPRIPNEGVRLKGDLVIDMQKGELGLLGTLNSDWNQPFGLRGTSILKDSAVTMSVDTASNVGLGVQGGLTVSGTPAFTNSLVCLNATLATGVPVVTALGLRFEADTLDPALALRLIEGAVGYAANSPEASKLASLPIAGKRTLGGAKLRNLFAGLDETPLPSVKDAKFYFVTPDLTCQSLFNKGVGARLEGTMSLLNQQLAATDSGFNLQDGFWLRGAIKSFDVKGFFKLDDAKVDIAAPMPTSPQAAANTRFRVSGRSKLAFASGDVAVNFSKDRVRFDTEGKLGEMFSASILGESVGIGDKPTTSLADTTDFKLSLAAKADTSALRQEILKGLATAIGPTAETERRKGKAQRPSAAALEKAKATAAQLDAEVGSLYRNLVNCLQGDTKACTDAGIDLANAAKKLKDMAASIEAWGRAEGHWLALSAQDQAGIAVETLWDALARQMNAVITAATGAASVVSIENVSFDGRLKSLAGTLKVDARLDPTSLGLGLARKDVSSSFDVSLGAGASQPKPPRKADYGELSREVAKSYAELKPLDQVPPVTTTHLSWDNPGGNFVLVAKVMPDRYATNPGGDRLKPEGAVTLYRVTKNGRTPIGINTSLNKQGCTEVADQARFPGGEGCNSTIDGLKPFALSLQPGANVFVAEYAGSGAYMGSPSNQIVIMTAESCGSLSKLDGATVRIAVSSGGAPFYASVNSASNPSGPDVFNPVYFYEKTETNYQTNGAGAPIRYWDQLPFKLKAIPGTQEFHVETFRGCSQGSCPRLKTPNDEGVALARATDSEWDTRWTIVRDPGGSVRLSSAGKLLGRTERPTTVAGPTINIRVNVRGRVTMLPKNSNREMLAALEEVCTAK